MEVLAGDFLPFAKRSIAFLTDLHRSDITYICLPAQMAQKMTYTEFFWWHIYSRIADIYMISHTNLKVVQHIITRDASVSVSVSVPIRSFSADRVSVRRDRSKSDVVCIVFCVKVKPHERHKNIIKHHKVLVHYISSVLRPFHSLIWGAYEYLSKLFSPLRLSVILSSAFKLRIMFGYYSQALFKSAQSLRFKTVQRKGSIN